jgi:exopolysaccharide biosynthesis polyprenyl glycosylphosphotransferase
MYFSQSTERRLLQGCLLIGDALGLLLAFIVAQFIRFPEQEITEHVLQLVREGRFATIYIVFVLAHYIFDLYEPRHWRSSLFSPFKIVFAAFTATFMLFAWFYFVATETGGVYGRGVLLGAISIFTIWSLAFRYFVNRSQVHRQQVREWLFVGGEASYKLLLRDWQRIQIGGKIHWLDRAQASLANLNDQLGRRWAGLIVEGGLPSEETKVLMQARLRGQVVLSLQSFYEFYCGKVPVMSLDDSWFAFSEGFSILHSQISIRLKRLSDILISAGMLTVMLPVLLVLYVLIRLESRGPALYSQVRVGQSGRTFVMWKFRSMRLDAEKAGAQWAAKNDNRVTRLGRFIRKVRLDEIPQLWNILKGEMSFIGPRPERPEFTAELAQKIPFYEFRHLVKPGLSGWAQVMYPYGASVEDAVEKLQFDLFYIKNYSFARDIEILLKTIAVVLFGAGR